MYNYIPVSPSQIEYMQVAPLADLPPGQRLFIEVDGLPIVILNVAGVLYAIGDVCSHDDGPVGDGSIEGNEIVCPRHGARFELATGKVTSMPAVVDIPAYPTRVVAGMLEIGIPKKT